MWEELLDLFEDLLDEYEKIEKLAEKKHGLLVTMNFAELEKILRQEEFLTKAVQTLEEKRCALLKKLAATDKRIGAATKMEELATFAPRREIREDLLSQHADLTVVTARVKELTENNEMLTKAALQAVNINLNRLGGAEVQGTYGSGGKTQVTRKKNFDYKA